MSAHIVDGEFQSDKYPTTPRGKVPLSVRDQTAQDLLWEYAQRRRRVDAEFSADLETALRAAGYDPAARTASPVAPTCNLITAGRLVAEMREDDDQMANSPWDALDNEDDDLPRFIVTAQGNRIPHHGGDLGGGATSIARMRNNLRPAADQLEATAAEVVRLRAILPICSQCDERPAACFGCYEGADPSAGPQPACDVCCGHGNEDGWCRPIGDLAAWATTASLTSDKLAEERDEARREVTLLIEEATHLRPVVDAFMRWSREAESLPGEAKVTLDALDAYNAYRAALGKSTSPAAFAIEAAKATPG